MDALTRTTCARTAAGLGALAAVATFLFPVYISGYDSDLNCGTVAFRSTSSACYGRSDYVLWAVVAGAAAVLALGFLFFGTERGHDRPVRALACLGATSTLVTVAVIPMLPRDAIHVPARPVSALGPAFPAFDYGGTSPHAQAVAAVVALVLAAVLGALALLARPTEAPA